MKITCCLVVCLAAGVSAAASDEKPQARAYTNEDLERLRSGRGETGVGSEPAVEPRNGPHIERGRPAARGEQFWRREAEREQNKLEPLRRRLQDLERKLAERRAKPPSRRGLAPADPVPETLLAQIQALKARIREQEGRFLDRARREGALPGWLRP